jgi:hypothetical protein
MSSHAQTIIVRLCLMIMLIQQIDVGEAQILLHTRGSSNSPFDEDVGSYNNI